MKKFAVLMIAGALALSTFAACGGSEGNDESKANSKEQSAVASVEDTNKEIDLPTLRDELKGKTVAAETLDKSADELFNDTGIADTTYVNFFWFSELSGLSSETVAVFEAKSETDRDTIKGFLDTYVQSATNQMKDYDAKNYDMLTKAVIKTSGLYVYLVVSPNAGDIDSAIASALT